MKNSNLYDVVQLKNKDLEGTNYSLEYSTIGPSLSMLRFLWKDSLLSNIIMYKDTEYIGHVFILNLDDYMIYETNENK